MKHWILSKIIELCSIFSKSVTEKEFNKLKSFNNELINDYLLIENFKSKNKYLLNVYEELIITGYTGFMGSPLNRILRNKFSKKEESFITYEYLLNKSLRKVISRSNDKVYVMYQSNGAKKELFDWYEARIEETIQFPNFLSSSLKKWDGYEVYLEIETNSHSSGKYTAPLTSKEKEKLEKEVTFLSNTKFKIKDVCRINKTIYLEETDINIQANYLLTDLYYKNYTNKKDIEKLI